MVFSHWVSLAITAPLAFFSAFVVVRSRGLLTWISMLAIVASLLICLNPIYNLAEDLAYIEHDDTGFLFVNVSTWLGIALSTGISLHTSQLLGTLIRWITGKSAEPVICEIR